MASHSLVLAFDRARVPHGELLDRQVEQLRAIHERGDRVAAEVLRGTGSQGTVEELPGSALTLDDARLAIARDHGYADWDAAREHADTMMTRASRRRRTRSSGVSWRCCAT